MGLRTSKPGFVATSVVVRQGEMANTNVSWRAPEHFSVKQ